MPLWLFPWILLLEYYITRSYLFTSLDYQLRQTAKILKIILAHFPLFIIFASLIGKQFFHNVPSVFQHLWFFNFFGIVHKLRQTLPKYNTENYTGSFPLISKIDLERPEIQKHRKEVRWTINFTWTVLLSKEYFIFCWWYRKRLNNYFHCWMVDHSGKWTKS